MVKQLTDFEHQVIIVFKEHPIWGLMKCAAILLEFFSHVSRHQFSTVDSHLSEITTSLLGAW